MNEKGLAATRPLSWASIMAESDQKIADGTVASGGMTGSMATVDMGSISVANTTGGTASEQAIKAAQASKDQLMLIYGVVSTKTQEFLAERRPANEFFDRSALDKPQSMGEAWIRIRKNAAYFKVNYAVVIAATVALSLLLNPLAALLIAGLGSGWAYVCLIRSDPIIVAGRTLSEREKVFCRLSYYYYPFLV